ncbi:MAG TPA: DNA-processing protein DprA [Casimicrobiaceae bacterium]
MPADARALAWVALARSAIPQRALVTLLRAFGSPDALHTATRRELEKLVAPALAARIVAERRDEPATAELDAAARWLDEPGHNLIAWDDADYPRALLELPDAPVVLFHLGRRDLLNQRAFAIVGSRNATPQGRAIAREFAAALGGIGLTIVSGLAAGIDAAAHEGALRTAGSTIAVVATGPDRVYPAKNRSLMAEIVADGAVITEFLPGTAARKENFPRRNRLISGLARGVLVVEATLSSGSLITARLAGEQGRDVFAIPGSIHSPFSKGCHKLIREGAKLVESAEDILGELGWAGASSATQASRGAGAEDDETSANAALDETLANAGSDETPASAARDEGAARAVLEAIGHGVATVDMIVERTGLAAAVVMAELVQQELAQRVAPLPGGGWQRLRAQ